MKRLATILMLALAAAAYAQNGEVDVDATYFHPAASLYIHGDSQSSSNLVAQGLAQFPDDGKLLRLKELLDKQQQKNQDNKDNQQDQNKDQKDQNKDQQKQQDQNKDQQQQDQNKDQQQKQQDQNQDQQQQDEQQEQQAEPPRAEQMSQDEAKRLLDAMKQEEENKRLQLHPVMGAPVKVDKDW